MTYHIILSFLARRPGHIAGRLASLYRYLASITFAFRSIPLLRGRSLNTTNISIFDGHGLGRHRNALGSFNNACHGLADYAALTGRRTPPLGCSPSTSPRRCSEEASANMAFRPQRFSAAGCYSACSLDCGTHLIAGAEGRVRITDGRLAAAPAGAQHASSPTAMLSRYFSKAPPPIGRFSPH